MAKCILKWRGVAKYYTRTKKKEKWLRTKHTPLLIEPFMEALHNKYQQKIETSQTIHMAQIFVFSFTKYFFWVNYVSNSSSNFLVFTAAPVKIHLFPATPITSVTFFRKKSWVNYITAQLFLRSLFRKHWPKRHHSHPGIISFPAKSPGEIVFIHPRFEIQNRNVTALSPPGAI